MIFVSNRSKIRVSPDGDYLKRPGTSILTRS